jgi:hypothetical protein
LKAQEINRQTTVKKKIYKFHSKYLRQLLPSLFTNSAEISRKSDEEKSFLQQRETLPFSMYV